MYNISEMNSIQQKEVLVILPGWRHNSSDWGKVISQLDKNFEVFFIDFPGFGSVPPDPNLTTIKEVVEWTKDRIEKELGNEKYVLCGHSFGGRIAGLIASENNDLVKRLVLIASPNIYRPSWKVRLIKVLSRMARPIKSVFGSNFLNKLRSDDYLNALNNNLSPLYKDTITNDQTETLGNISVPTLLIACENDTSVPLSSIDEIYNLIPNSEKIVIKSAGHNIHLEKPELLSAKIINYA